jgi:tetratricopeptide (TPR) repeat protein
MGQVKEVNVKSEAMEDPEKLKGEGNDAFKAGRYEEALLKYTKAIYLTDKENDKSTYLKNRADVHLKNDDYGKAVEDCTSALEISQNDPKALYGRCQAYEALDKVEQAYSDAKAVHNCDPKNKAIEPFLLRLHAKVQAKIN